jgi:hypothetical protein
MATKLKYYVGLKGGYQGEVFQAESTPTDQTHGGLYKAAIGPFRTKRGAAWMANTGTGLTNPHCRTVRDAERLAKKYAGQAV